MFVGHYSAALAAKAARPHVPVWTLLVAAQFVDILWGVFVLSGIEHVRLDPTLASNPLDLYHMPYTHSLVGSLFWAGVGFMLARRVLGLPPSGAGAVAAVVLSHWFLDVPVHRPDLPLVAGPTKLGLGLWNYPVAAYLLEVVLVVASTWLCVRALRAARVGPWIGFAGGLLLVQTATTFGPLPPSVAGMVLSALALYLLVPWIGGRVERAGARSA